MAIVGAYLRCTPETAQDLPLRLNAIAGVETLPLAQPCVVGLTIEAAALDEVYLRLSREIPALPGVLGIWPIYVNDEAEASTLIGSKAQPQAAASGCSVHGPEDCLGGTR